LNTDSFFDIARKLLVEYVNKHLDKTDNIQITYEDVYIVWSSKVLQNNKALLRTTLPDGCYYEVTYNGDKDEMYIDVYKKWENICVHDVASGLDKE
jgi:hypothetical protein